MLQKRVQKHGYGAKYLDTFIFFLESELSPEREHIVCFSHNSNNNEKFIFFNPEQLSRPPCLQNILDICKNKNIVEIWDYSEANINILNKHNINVRLVQIESPKWYIDKLYSFREKHVDSFEYDVGFAGLITPRRGKILDELYSLGIKVNRIQQFGDARDMELAKCKIMLNIHAFEDYNIFEIARCEPWLQLGVVFISENSLDNDSRCINVNYAEIVNTVVKYLNV